MRKIMPLLLVSILIMSACGGSQPTNNEISESGEVLGATQAPATPAPSADTPIRIPVYDDTNPPGPNMLRSRLTYEWVDAETADTRPVAIMIPNESAALPQYNLSKASILYEADVEGHMTRLLGIFEDWSDLDYVGNIRSLRSYFAYWAFEWDAILVHIGGPFYVDSLLAQDTTENIDGNLDQDAAAFFRSTDRQAPHNAFTTGEGLLDAVQEHGYSLYYRELAEIDHYRFTSQASPNTLVQYGGEAVNATYIDMSSCYPLTRCRFEYNEADGLYYRFQHLDGAEDGPHIDGATGEQLSFKNILVQYVHQEDLGEGYLDIRCQDSSLDGWYFTNGRGIHVRWEKTSDYGATHYYDDAGEEIVLNAGKTMILIVQEGSTFLYH